jgi:predicted phosphodiesterase
MKKKAREERSMDEGALVGLMADTHDNRDAIVQAVELFNERRVQLVLRAEGDQP